MGLFYVKLDLFSPTGKPVMHMAFSWYFVLKNGNRIHQDNQMPRHHPLGLTTDSDIQTVNVQRPRGDEDLLCHLRMFVKKRMPEVNIELSR
jgi:hypothetical protein